MSAKSLAVEMLPLLQRESPEVIRMQILFSDYDKRAVRRLTRISDRDLDKLIDLRQAIAREFEILAAKPEGIATLGRARAGGSRKGVVRRNFANRTGGDRRCRLSSEQFAAIFRLHAQELPNRAIAARLQIHPGSVRRIIRHHQESAHAQP